MSYTMTHLMITYQFMQNRTVENKALFLVGGMSPDAVHSREDFTFDLKGEAHQLQKEEKWGHTYTKEAMDIWYGRVRDFYREKTALVKTAEARSFLQGYTLHLLVDIFNCSLLYAPNLIRYEHKVEAMREQYRKECILQDNYLYQSSPHTTEIISTLRETVQRGLTDDLLREAGLDCYISKADVAATLQYQAEGYAKAERADISGLTMISENSTEYFLKTVENECERLLFSFPEVYDTFTVGGKR